MHHPIIEQQYERMERAVREGRHLEPKTTSDSVFFWARYLIAFVPTLGVMAPYTAGGAFFARKEFHIIEVILLHLLCLVALFGWVKILAWFALTHALPAHPVVLSLLALPFFWFVGYLVATSDQDMIDRWHQKYHGSRV